MQPDILGTPLYICTFQPSNKIILEELLAQLNPEQRAAVEATEGPIMVIAGAGSGKTRVLTFRIAYLIREKEVDPFQILALTFTNKAAREMKERIGNIVGASEAKSIWMGTFHSVFARILRFEAGVMGYPSNFTIYDTEDQSKLISKVVKELNLDKDIYKTKSVQRRISAYKNGLITPNEYAQSPELQSQDAAAKMPQLGEVFKNYNDRCFRAGAMDFDDILLNTYMLFRHFPEILGKYQSRFRYIMVDEYQDTNHAQYLIVKSLANKFQNICVVGDDAQSIYAFRGANIQNILNYQKDYEVVKAYKLEQNYRSTKNIVGAANSLIEKNREQLKKDVWTSNDDGAKIIINKTVSDNDEGNYVARMIFESHMNHQLDYSNFAILYRTNAQSRAMEDALRRKNIPYRIYGGLSFYQRKEVKDVLAYLRLVINPKDEEALRRVVNYPARGIGNTTLEKLTLAANRDGISLWEAIDRIEFYPDLRINGPTQLKLKDFALKIKSYESMLSQYDAFDLTAHVAKSTGLLKEFSSDKTPEGVTRYENIQELLNSVKEFSDNQKELDEGDPSLASFMQDVALITDADKDDPNDKNKVSLMTIHLAKGLEFAHVFIVGMEENLFPSMMTVNSRSDLEEERRLFYVALTRAEKQAYLTYTQMRYRWGKLIDCEPSRFLEEIDQKFLDINTPEFSPFGGFESKRPGSEGGFRKPNASRKAESRGIPQRNTVPPKHRMGALKSLNQIGDSAVNNSAEVNAGDRVKHQRFGVGNILEIEGSGPNKKATIKFDNVGEKKLLLKFAKLEKI